MSAVEFLLNQLPTQGLFNLPLPATLTVSGPDAQTFLQGQLTCNIQDINDRQSRLGAYCDIKGRVVGLFRIIQVGLDYHLLMDPEMLEIVAKTLKRYAVFSKVTLNLSSPFSQRIGILDNLRADIPGLPHFNLPEQENEVLTEASYILYKLPGKFSRWELLLQNSAPHIEEPFEHGATLWEAFDILSGLPTLKAATSAHFTAHKLGLIPLNAVSFNKGCYLGQEIVARTQYLGTQKGGLFWAALANAQLYKPNTEIKDEQQQAAGNIINSIGINDKLSLVLVCLKQDPQKDKTFFIDNNQLEFAAFFSDDFLFSKS